MALDFFGVYIAASITTFDPVGGYTEFDLWTKSTENPLPPSLAALSNLAYVTEVQVEHMMGKNSRISLTMTPPFLDGLEIINSPLIQWGVGRLKVTIGYTTGSGAILSEPFEGLLMKPDVHIGSDITITMNATGVGYSLSTAANTAGRHFDAGTTWAETIDAVLADYKDLNTDEIWADFGLSSKQKAKGASVNHSLFKPRLDETVKDKNSNDVQQALAIDVGPRNDWWYLAETCKSHATEFYVEGKKVYVKNRDKWLKSQPNGGVKKFRVRGGVDPANNIFPVLELASPSEGEWLKQGGGEVVQADVHVDKSGKNEVSHDNKSTTPTQTTTGTIDKTNNIAGKVTTVGIPMPGNPGQSQAAATGVGEFKNTTYMMGIKIEVDTIGIPNLVPGEVIQLSGTENSQGRGIFNGEYGVQSVTHSIGVGGYSSHFEALGNFLPEIFANAVKSSGPITPTPTDASNSQPGVIGQSKRITINTVGSA